MGLIGALLKLPLAPLTGTVWVAERIQEQAEAEYYDEGAIQAQLREVDAARQAGEILDGGLGRERQVAGRELAVGAVVAHRALPSSSRSSSSSSIRAASASSISPAWRAASTSRSCAWIAPSS